MWRGPASAVRAFHGAINVVTPVHQGFSVGLEGGPMIIIGPS